MTAWITLDEAKTELKVTSSADDAQLQSYIDAACAAIDRQFGPIGPEARTEFVESYGTSRVLLERAPVVSVTSVTEYAGATPTVLNEEPIDGDTFTDDGYRVEPTAGFLLRTSSDGRLRRFAATVKVVYIAGYDPIPDDAKRGALELVRHLWETQRGRSTGRPLAGIDDVAPPPGSGYAFPNRVIELLAPFRMPRL